MAKEIEPPPRWKVRKHGASKRRMWRKLHLGVGVESQEIISCVLTNNSVDDAAMTLELLSEVEGKAEGFYGDGAYDKSKHAKQWLSPVPKPLYSLLKNVVRSKDSGKMPGLAERDTAIDRIKQIGRKEWKKESGYHKRSLSEVALHRYKGTIANTLSARKFENQETEVKIGCHILNVFRRCGMPHSVKI